MTITDLMQRFGELACDRGWVHTTGSERRLCLRAQPGWDERVESWMEGPAVPDALNPCVPVTVDVPVGWGANPGADAPRHLGAQGADPGPAPSMQRRTRR
jgi:hypothetical protein